MQLSSIGGVTLACSCVGRVMRGLDERLMKPLRAQDCMVCDGAYRVEGTRKGVSLFVYGLIFSRR